MNRNSIKEFAQSEKFQKYSPTVIKIIFVAVLIVFLLAVYSARNAADVSLDSIDAALQKQTDIASMDKCGSRQLLQFIGIDASAYDSFLYYKSNEALSVDELLIVKARQSADLDSVQDAVETRIDDQTRTFEGYGPGQVARLKDAIVERRGNYLFYCVAENPETYREVFEHAV